MPRILGLLCIGWLGLAVARGQTPPPAAAASAAVDAVKRPFDTAVRELQQQEREAPKQLAQSYLAGLAALEDALQAAGNLSAVLAVHGERARFQQAGDMPDGVLAANLPALRRLQDGWRAQTAALPREQARKLVALSERYLQTLAALQQNLAARGDAPGVAAVRAEKDRLLGNHRLREALTLVQADRPAAGAAPAGGGQPAGAAAGSAGKKAAWKDITGELSGGVKHMGSLVLHGQRAQTRESYAPPLEIEYVCKTDSTNIRLAYACHQLIFNWEMRPDELRIDGGPVSGQHKHRMGRVPANQFVTIRQVVLKDRMEVFVDEKSRAKWEGDFSEVHEPIGLFTQGGCTLTIKALRIKPR